MWRARRSSVLELLGERNHQHGEHGEQGGGDEQHDGDRHLVVGPAVHHLAERLGLIEKDTFDFLWVTDFPLFEYSEEEGRYVAMHHPFTSWMEEDEELLETAPDQVRAKAYDLVLNGIEMGSGSIRIHRSDMQSRMFDMIGLSPEEAKHRFGFLLEAFKYGTPPHGGFAFGVDRLVMILTGSENLREVVAFPKAQNANCLMMQTPSDVQEEQLKMLHIRVADDEQE